jgi:hypothetical protein
MIPVTPISSGEPFQWPHRHGVSDCVYIRTESPSNETGENRRDAENAEGTEKCKRETQRGDLFPLSFFFSLRLCVSAVYVFSIPAGNWSG